MRAFSSEWSRPVSMPGSLNIDASFDLSQRELGSAGGAPPKLKLPRSIGESHGKL
jgi:hypothetical protein